MTAATAEHKTALSEDRVEGNDESLVRALRAARCKQRADGVDKRLGHQVWGRRRSVGSASEERRHPSIYQAASRSVAALAAYVDHLRVERHIGRRHGRPGARAATLRMYRRKPLSDKLFRRITLRRRARRRAPCRRRGHGQCVYRTAHGRRLRSRTASRQIAAADRWSARRHKREERGAARGSRRPTADCGVR